VPIAAITYDIKPNCEAEIEAVFSGFRRTGSTDVRDGSGTTTTRILGTALFIRDDTMVRFIEYEGDLDAVARHMASQPGVQEVERRLAPYLARPRDTSTVEGFVATFQRSLLRCISRLSLHDGAPAVKK
jgi:hypothetical protein